MKSDTWKNLLVVEKSLRTLLKVKTTRIDNIPKKILQTNGDESSMNIKSCQQIWNATH